jgi:GTPase SAR1 family protein
METVQDPYERQTEIDRKSCTVELLDTGSFDVVKILKPEWSSNPHGAIFVYDICNSETFTILETYIKLFISHSGTATITLVGNRTGRPGSQVSTAKLCEMANRYGCTWCEISTENHLQVEAVVVDHIRRLRNAPVQQRLEPAYRRS